MLHLRSFVFAGITVVLYGLSSSVLAKLSLGLELNYTLEDSTTETKLPSSSSYSSQTNTYNYNRTNFSIIPYVGIRPINLLEISPLFGFYVYSYTIDDKGTTNRKTKYTQVGIGPGIGFYFHVFENSILDISLGPKLKSWFYFRPSSKSGTGSNLSETKYDKYHRMSMALGGQVNIDFLISERVSLRLTSSLIDYYYYKYTSKIKNSTSEYTRKNSSFDIHSLFKPSFGFQLQF